MLAASDARVRLKQRHVGHDLGSWHALDVHTTADGHAMGEFTWDPKDEMRVVVYLDPHSAPHSAHFLQFSLTPTNPGHFWRGGSSARSGCGEGRLLQGESTIGYTA